MIAEWKIEGGIVLIDKPLEWTSFDVVKRLRNRLKYKKIGHAGTLDPLATGLLVVCFGRFTKRIEEIQAMPKVYEATVRFGESTPSYDLETKVDATYPTAHIDEEAIRRVLPDFTGEIQQVPPLFSAVKLDGVRAYEYARKGEHAEIKSRSVQIHALEILHWDAPDLHLRIRCGKGTYIRSLARDLGEALGSGAHLTSLSRTQIGPFVLKDARPPDHFNAEDDFYLHRLTDL